jgi:hypothetical protein
VEALKIEFCYNQLNQENTNRVNINLNLLPGRFPGGGIAAPPFMIPFLYASTVKEYNDMLFVGF